MKRPPLSILLAIAYLALVVAYGFYSFPNIDFLSARGLGRFSTFAFALVALISIFTSPNLGRLLAIAFFLFGGLTMLSVCFIASMNGADLGAILLLSCIAAFHLTLSVHLLFGAAARNYAKEEASDTGT